MVTDLTKIEDRIDKIVAGATEISMAFGGIQFRTMAELFEMAKMMAISQAAVPSHLRGNPGACLAICTRALRWGFDPFAVAEKSYLVNNRGEERIAFESQLVHAVIEAHAPITGRLRFRYEEEGEERRCIVYATPKGEEKPLEYRSEPIKKLRPARNDQGKVRGSPLWDTKPDMQLFYSASRDWCRTYFPDTLMGIYTKDEVEETPAERARDITPKPDVGKRLRGAQGRRGFDADHVERQTASATKQEAAPAPAAGAAVAEAVATVEAAPAPAQEPHEPQENGTSASPTPDLAAAESPTPDTPDVTQPESEPAMPAAEILPPEPEPEPERDPFAADPFAGFMFRLAAEAATVSSMGALDALDDQACEACQQENREDQRIVWNVVYATNRNRIANAALPANKGE